MRIRCSDSEVGVVCRCVSADNVCNPQPTCESSGWTGGCLHAMNTQGMDCVEVERLGHDCSYCQSSGRCPNYHCSESLCGSHLSSGGTCESAVALGYNCTACRFDGFCPVAGCMNSLAINYNPAATLARQCHYICPNNTREGTLYMRDSNSDGWGDVSWSIGCPHAGMYVYQHE
eukprot:COSAG01_NODE_36354_length_519_cov_0.604762_1_plen_173_part_11